MEIVTWAAVGVACQQQFSYNLVIKFGSVNAINVHWIQFTFDAHRVNANSICTQTESSVKRFLVLTLVFSILLIAVHKILSSIHVILPLSTV